MKISVSQMGLHGREKRRTFSTKPQTVYARALGIGLSTRIEQVSCEVIDSMSFADSELPSNQGGAHKSDDEGKTYMLP